MEAYFTNIKEQASGYFTTKTITDKDSCESNSEDTQNVKPPLHQGFHLPITYLDESKKYELSTIVCSDLELKDSLSDSKSMYEILFRPSHDFAKALIPDWSKQYTTDTNYLNDTQMVLHEMPKYLESVRNMNTSKENISTVESVLDTQKIVEIWQAIKEDESFMERYSFIDWEILHHLNDSAYFLQIMSMTQLVSPILSLIMPFLLLLIPFFLLKIRGVNISISNYVNMLQTITKNHFIGMLMNQIKGTFSIQKLSYLILIVAFYGFQIYQNIQSCIRFHRNINKINQHLLDMKHYISNVVNKMECFSAMHSYKPSYTAFCNHINKHQSILSTLLSELSQIQPFAYNTSTASSFGYWLRCYYRIYSITEYGNALRYSFGFEGYVDNLKGVYENYSAGYLTYADFSETTASQFIDQYYPPHISKDNTKGAIANTCRFNKNMIISAPNAAGKTTLLKSTAINIVFSQQIGCGFYGKGTTIRPYTHIHSYLNIPDTSGRDSLFQAESRRCKEIIDIVSNNVEGCFHFAIFDELYSGTNPTEAGKSAYAFLKYLSKYDNVNFMLTTHYVYVCKKFKKSKTKKSG